jgi:hypothetical protein
MNFAAVLGVMLVAAQPVTVESGACPSAQAIERGLAPLLPPLPAGMAPDVARVLPQGRSLHVALQSSDGVVIAERTLEPTGSCADLAQVVAVVIAAWESDVHPAFVRPQTEIASPAPTETVSAAPTTGTPVSVPARTSSYDLAAGGGVSFSDSAVAGADVAVTFAPWGSGLAFRISGTGEAQHQTSLGQGQAQWRRWTGSTELDWRFVFGPTVLDLHGGLLFGLLSAQGSGFFPSEQATSFSPGLTAGARVMFWAGRSLGFCLGVVGQALQRNQSLVLAAPSESQHELSHFQGLVSLGVAVGRAPERRATTP